MKKVISILLALFCAGMLFAAEGALWGEKDLRKVSTEWFDIIYPQSCEQSAIVLFENADSIYQSLSDMYNSPIPCRMTVTLTTAVELYNAYWSNGYYNRIVLYLAPPMDECNVESDNLLKTFHHELTHAFTYNMKTPFWKWVGKVFGDCVYPAYPLVTGGMSEGATVSSESYDGEGRLNDEFAKQMVKQAKLENQFPKFHEVQGARDVYPYGGYYFFNGAFHEWLQIKYGFEPYKEWWFKCINFNAITISRAFYKSYGTKLQDEWKQFIEEYEVPAIPGNPVEAGIVKDFFQKDSDEYSAINAAGYLPRSLSLSEKGLTYINEKNRAVFFVPTEKLNDTKVKPKLLFTDFYAETAKQSADGKFIAVSSYTTDKPTYKYFTQIYNTETKKWYKINENGIKDASIVQKNGKYYVVALKFHGEDYKIRITELLTEDKKIIGESEPVYIPYTRTQLPASYTDIGNGNFAFALKDVLTYTICVADLEGNILKTIPVPFDRMVIRYFSYSAQDNALYFSWTKPGSMPRLGVYSLNNDTFALDDEDISGGVYYPVKFGNEVIYAGTFYTSNKIFVMDDITYGSIEDLDDVESAEQLLTESVAQIESEEAQSEEAEVQIKKALLSEKYNPFSFYTKGMIYPFTNISSKIHNVTDTSAYSLPFGVTYQTNDPFGAHFIKAALGYGWKTNSAGFSLDYNGGTDTQLFKYYINLYSEIDRYGWKQSEISIETNTTWPFAHISEISVSPYGLLFLGHFSASTKQAEDRLAQLAATDSQSFVLFKGKKFETRLGEFESADLTNVIYTYAQLALSYDNIRRIYPDPYSRIGFYVGAIPFYTYNSKLKGGEVIQNNYDIAFLTKGYIPALIPIDCKEGYTYNLPTKIVLGLFGAEGMASSMAYTYGAFPNFAFINAETVLFGMNIQKVIPGLSFLYVHDARVTLSGTYGSNYNENTISDNLRILKIGKYMNEVKEGNFSPYGTASLKLVVGGTPLNFGQFYSTKFNIYASGNLYISNTSVIPLFEWGFDTNF